MKKKQKPSAVVSGVVDLKALIRENRIFFDNLVNLIPPKFYLPIEEDSRPWYPGLSKSKKASLKRQTRENIRRARRNRLDPEKKVAQSSTLGLLKESIDKTKHEDDSGNEKPLDFGEGDDNENGERRSVTYEELRQRLRMRIEALRGNRGSGQKSERKRFADDGDLAESNGNKRKRDDDRQGNSEKNSSNGVDSGDLPSDVTFGKVKIGDDEEGKKKKKKLPKEKELERLKKLEELKKEKPNVAEKQSWKAAADRAMGVKVHDDPRLLKESMKKEKKKKEKSSEKWKERVETRDKFKEERQQKRRENISGRIHDKKMRKIAKREKKLMRPGFEGRKQEFITEN